MGDPPPGLRAGVLRLAGTVRRRPAGADGLAGLPANLRFHDMRHTCAALLIAANLPPKAIQDHLGHSDFKITMNPTGISTPTRPRR